MSKHIMLDLETLGTSAKAVIVAIGAVAFDLEDDSVYETFYLTVDAKSGVQAGLVMDPDTVVWWLQQSEQAREIFKGTSQGLSTALNLFSAWVKEVGPVGVWGNGVDFDNVIIMNSYLALGMKMPYRYSKNRCFRTMRGLFPTEGVVREGTHHNAVDDAVFQMKVLKEINTKYNLQLK